ncbi:uncharacterized protein LOC131235433 [Magnolia sinica]|uniref:uncharacterized protein LOC131235433 n=1 Tax=Magnolia sinica TaxID=86752 RepID=UPI00265A0A41|nr:uncharacterized protein LOC131235433 [Magnolia sinica]
MLWFLQLFSAAVIFLYIGLICCDFCRMARFPLQDLWDVWILLFTKKTALASGKKLQSSVIYEGMRIPCRFLGCCMDLLLMVMLTLWNLFSSQVSTPKMMPCPQTLMFGFQNILLLAPTQP